MFLPLRSAYFGKRFYGGELCFTSVEALVGVAKLFHLLPDFGGVGNRDDGAAVATE